MADGLPEIPSSRPGEVVVWDAATGREVRTLRGHARRVFCVAFSRDGRQIVSAGDDRCVRIWDAATGRELRLLRGHSSAVVAVAFSPDGSRIASAEARTGTVKVWDASETPGVRVDPEGRQVVAFTAPGASPARLVAAGVGDTVRLRDPAGARAGRSRAATTRPSSPLPPGRTPRSPRLRMTGRSGSGTAPTAVRPC